MRINAICRSYSLGSIVLICFYCLGDAQVVPTIKNSVASQQRAELRKRQVRYLALNGYAHHMTQVPEFAEMFHVYDPNFRPIARETYINGLCALFRKMIDGITQLSEECRRDMGDMGNWLSIIQDIWTSINNDSIVGSSMKLMSKDMVAYTIAAVLDKNNVSHGAKEVAAQLQNIYLDRFKIDLETEAGFAASDTTGSAANVSKNIGAHQKGCELHIVALVLIYTLGWSENTKTITEVDAVSSFLKIIRPIQCSLN